MKLALSSLAIAVLPLAAARAQGPGSVLGEQRITEGEGNFGGDLEHLDAFGYGVAALNDLDGNGVLDLAVGAPGDDDGNFDRGAVWLLLLNADGTVKAHQKVSDAEGGFTGGLEDADEFGFDVDSLGDFDGDGSHDLVVGTRRGEEFPTPSKRGELWIVLLKANGTVKFQRKIGEGEGGFTGTLEVGDLFGTAVASLGDLDGDGTGDVAVGASRDDDGFLAGGAVWILFLNPDGSVKSHQKISDTAGGFTGGLDFGDYFGTAIDALGDLDGDGTEDVAVGAPGDNFGAVWILFLNPDGTVKAHQKIDDQNGGFTGTLDGIDQFGESVCAAGDVDGDGVVDLAVGAPFDQDASGANLVGSLWILFLNTDGTVKGHRKIGDGEGGLTASLPTGGFFGSAGCSLGDVDGDGAVDLAVGAAFHDGVFPTDHGAVYVLFLAGAGPDVVPYGCGVNPADSLTVVSGEPAIGTVLTLGVDNPLGTQAAGSLPFVALALAPDPAFPCGTLVPGLGMGGTAELLINVLPPDPLDPIGGTPWTGPGSPAPVVVPVPNDPLLIGLSVFSQAVLVDPSPGASVPIGLTDALELRIDV